MERHESTFSRRISPELCITITLLNNRGRREDRGWPLHPGPPRKRNLRERDDHRYRRRHSGLPCAVVLRLIGALPGEPAFATVIFAKLLSYPRELSACMGAPGPHDFAVRECATRQLAPSRPPHPRLTFRDDRDTPLLKARRDDRNIRLILPSEKRKYFYARGLTRIRGAGPAGKSLASERSFQFRRLIRTNQRLKRVALPPHHPAR